MVRCRRSAGSSPRYRGHRSRSWTSTVATPIARSSSSSRVGPGGNEGDAGGRSNFPRDCRSRTRSRARFGVTSMSRTASSKPRAVFRSSPGDNSPGSSRMPWWRSADPQLRRGAQHAVGHHPPDLTRGERCRDRGHARTWSRKRDQVSGRHVPDTNHYLTLDRSGGDSCQTQLVGVRMIADLQDLRHDHAVEALPRAFDAFSTSAPLAVSSSARSSRRQVDGAELPQPRAERSSCDTVEAFEEANVALDEHPHVRDVVLRPSRRARSPARRRTPCIVRCRIRSSPRPSGAPSRRPATRSIRSRMFGNRRRRR